MDKLREAARRVVDAWDLGEFSTRMDEAITALRESLAVQAEQEPVGRWNWNEAKFEWLTKFDYYKHHMTPLYTAPVRTKDLTDDEIAEVIGWALDEFYLADFRAVIAKFKEKNK